jgi:hypothetical protein
MRYNDPFDSILLMMFSALLAGMGYIGAIVVVAAPWLIKPFGVTFVAFSAVTLWMLWRPR